jgi:peptide/nickel transport system permease protein
MSEPQLQIRGEDAGTGGAAAGTAVAPVPDAVRAGPAESNAFAAIVWRALKRPLTVRIAMSWIVLLILLAVFAPFLANSRPFTIFISDFTQVSYNAAGEAIETLVPAHREFPLFAMLGKVDMILLAVFAGLVACLITMRLTRRISEPDMRGHARFRRMGAILGVTALIALLLGLFWSTPNDPRDFKRMVREGKASGAIFAPIRWGPADMEPLERGLTFQTPTRDHWLGTDGNGRDALARLLWGTRIVLGIGIIAEVIAVAIGITMGALMGYFVGKTDLLGMRLVEIFESMPTFFLILTFVAIYGRQIFIIMVIIGLTGWTGIARFVRAEFLRLRQLDYVQAAIAGGLPLRRVLFRHIMPNGLTPVIVSTTFGVAGTVMIESSLSFLGVGVEPPTPSWGSMLFEAGNPAETFRWWLAIAPGLLIFLTVFAYNILGEGLRDAIDPRTNKVR